MPNVISIRLGVSILSGEGSNFWLLYRGVSENGSKYEFFSGLDWENCECQSSDPPNKQHRNTSSSAKSTAILPVMCSPELCKKSYKKKKRTHIWTLYFTPLPGRPCVADFYHFWHVESHRRLNHPCQILVRLIEGLGGYGCPKSGVSHWLWSSPLQQCYALPCYTVITSVCALSVFVTPRALRS